MSVKSTRWHSGRKRAKNHSLKNICSRCAIYTPTSWESIYIDQSSVSFWTWIQKIFTSCFIVYQGLQTDCCLLDKNCFCPIDIKSSLMQYQVFTSPPGNGNTQVLKCTWNTVMPGLETSRPLALLQESSDTIIPMSHGCRMWTTQERKGYLTKTWTGLSKFPSAFVPARDL